MHRTKEIHVDVPVPTTSLSSYFFGCHWLIYLSKTNFSEPVQDQWIPKALFLISQGNVCNGYSLEAAPSNLNGSFTLSRLMKQPKTCCNPSRQLRFFFFVKYTESVSTMLKPIRRRTPTQFLKMLFTYI